jgi:hypothetical protein
MELLTALRDSSFRALFSLQEGNPKGLSRATQCRIVSIGTATITTEQATCQTLEAFAARSI